MIAGEGETAPLNEDVARLREAVEAFRRRPKTGRTQEQVSHELSQVRVICDVMEVEFSDLASEFAATEEDDKQGLETRVSVLKQVCRMSSGGAGDRVCAGDHLHRLGESPDALAMGEIGFAHFALIARTAAAVGRRFDEAGLL